MNDRNRSSGVVPNSPGAREALQKEGKLVVSGAVFLHGNDAWLFVEDHMLEFSPVYAVANGETVAVLFPFTPLPAAKA